MAQQLGQVAAFATRVFVVAAIQALSGHFVRELELRTDVLLRRRVVVVGAALAPLATQNLVENTLLVLDVAATLAARARGRRPRHGDRYVQIWRYGMREWFHNAVAACDVM